MDDAQFDSLWFAIVDRARQLREAGQRHGLQGNWDDGNYRDPVIEIVPPASEAQLRAVEKAIGEPLPQSLRQLFSRGSSAVRIAWDWPHKQVRMRGGWGETKLLNPPTISPSVTGGHVEFSLDQIASQHADQQACAAEFRARAEDDPDEAEYYNDYAAFWQRGFAFLSATNGDLVAVDRESPTGALLLLNHEGDSPPGWYLAHGPVQFLDHLSRLGFPHINSLTIADFNNPTLEMCFPLPPPKPGADPSDLPDALILDALQPSGLAWARFFYGQDS